MKAELYDSARTVFRGGGGALICGPPVVVLFTRCGETLPLHGANPSKGLRPVVVARRKQTSKRSRRIISTDRSYIQHSCYVMRIIHAAIQLERVYSCDISRALVPEQMYGKNRSYFLPLDVQQRSPSNAVLFYFPLPDRACSYPSDDPLEGVTGPHQPC